MDVKIKFLGAAQTVTGSKYLLKAGDKNILIDCGLFQGLKDLRLLNWDVFPINPSEIDIVILTHAHIDHCGYLPRLCRDGFEGNIYCTTATADLLEIMLYDSAKLQEEETEVAIQKGYSKHNNPEPLYTTKDVDKVLPKVKAVDYDEIFEPLPKIQVQFLDAGHILGSAIAEITVSGERMTKKIVFSGDLGRYDKPILFDPPVVKQADVLLVESTYGDRLNRIDSPEQAFQKIILDAIDRKGCLVIPAFAVGRTQLLLYYLKRLKQEKMIPDIPVYVDSPMAIDVTFLYQRYPRYFKQELFVGMGKGSPFHFSNLHFCDKQTESNALRDLKQNAIIISASGMCTGGRILSHLYQRLPKPNDTILLVGYQAAGTRGKRLLEGEKSIKIFGEPVQVHAHIDHLDGLSAHADKDELLRWLAGFEDSPKMTFVTHGEPESAKAFAQTIQTELGWHAQAPEYLETVSLFQGI
ncbi:MAG TPA: MBL fold hydrolase [Microscillaceae bacterium]|jgi:metallo-beta-lactamase family protein|nr:MBL fold hydrolase [Microscillaceae bacterium]